MTQPFIGEIRFLPFSRTPTGWLACNGSLTSIAQYETLFVLIGTTYGGDGVTTFAVPDLRGRVPLHQGNGRGLTPRQIGSVAGSESVSLQASNAGHVHTLLASADIATTTTPAADLGLAAVATGDTLYCYGTGTARSAVVGATSLSAAGQGQPHDNCAPTLPVSAFICWAGVFPSQS